MEIADDREMFADSRWSGTLFAGQVRATLKFTTDCNKYFSPAAYGTKQYISFTENKPRHV